MTPLKKIIAIPVLIIGHGCFWLLNILEIVPGVEWIWTGGLALVGVLTLAH